jgi:hypothetical protein
VAVDLAVVGMGELVKASWILQAVVGMGELVKASWILQTEWIMVR